MIRSQMNENKTFAATVSAYTKEIESSLGQRRKEMAKAWDDLDRGWKELEQRMTELGITTPSASNEGLVQLNVGGSHVNVRRSVLGAEEESPSTWTLGRVFESVWDKRLPRDSDGRIVLDESPACVKHLIHMLLRKSGTGSASLGSRDDFATDEAPNLPYVARALGLSRLCPELGLVVEGGSTVLEPDELGPLTTALQGWCPSEPKRLELVYRASRDGWSAANFHAICRDDAPWSFTLIRVQSVVAGSSDSVVGGFSSVPWTPSTQNRTPSPGAFLFMLKDGNIDNSSAFRPVKWGIRPGHARHAVSRSAARGPDFGKPSSLRIHRDVNHQLHASNTSYEIPEESAFLALDRQPVIEVEVFRVCLQTSPSPPPAKRAKVAEKECLDNARDTDTALSTGDRGGDADKFGKAIAGALMEERIALQQARADLKQADMRATECAAALEQLYGPDVASGEDDAVVELSVRGTRMTTLHSTLQACPESALAARFDSNKWPATEKDVDGEGWRLLDCRPSVFSKVLDVLRMRKRARWVENESQQAGESILVRVEIKDGDRPSFDNFVNMYFPGCENFIMECVKSPEVSEADP